MVVDSLISAAKVCEVGDCVKVCDRVVELRFGENILCQPLILFGKATLDSGKLDLGLVSAGSNDIEP